MMKFVPAEDEERFEKLKKLDYTAIGTILAKLDPTHDAFDVLRDVLVEFQARERRGLTH